MFINDLQMLEIFLYFRVWIDMNVTDIDVNLIDWNVMITAEIKLCLHAFYNDLVHSLILGMEFVFLVVQSVQKILYV